jgi:hypothetical protein
MQLGIDFDGAITEYIVCQRSGAGDGRVIQRFNTQKEAEELIASYMRKYRDNIVRLDKTFWIMRITHRYKRITDRIRIANEEKGQ